MILVLTNGERVTVHRMNCGYQKGNEATGGRNWNINPPRIVEQKQPGFFVIAEWGSGIHSSAIKMIPVSSVVYVKRPHEWEREAVEGRKGKIMDKVELRKEVDKILVTDDLHQVILKLHSVLYVLIDAIDKGDVMNDKQAGERLDLIQEAIDDCRAGKLSPFATLTAIGMVACPGEISEEQRAWAIDAFSKVERITETQKQVLSGLSQLLDTSLSVMLEGTGVDRVDDLSVFDAAELIIKWNDAYINLGTILSAGPVSI